MNRRKDAILTRAVRMTALLTASTLFAACTSAPTEPREPAGPRWLRQSPAAAPSSQNSSPSQDSGERHVSPQKPTPEEASPTVGGGTPPAPPTFFETGWKGTRSLES